MGLRSRSRPLSADAVRLPHSAGCLTESRDYRELAPVVPRRGRIGVVPAGAGGSTGEYLVVEGIGDYCAAVAAGETQFRVGLLKDLIDEDPAVIEMRAARDLVPDVKDTLLLGLAYRVAAESIRRLPKRNERKHRVDHWRRHGMPRAARLRDKWAEVFHHSETELRRYARALDAPPAVRAAFRAGRVKLYQVLEVAAADRAAAAAVDADIAAGASPADALARHLPPRDRERSPKAAFGTLLKGLRRGVDELAGRVARVRRPTGDDVAVLAAGGALISELIEHGRRPADTSAT